MLTPLIYIAQRTNGFEFSYSVLMGNLLTQDAPSLMDVIQKVALAYQEETGFELPRATPVHLRLALHGEVNTTFEQLENYPIDDSALFPRTDENLRKISEGCTFYCDANQNRLIWNET